MAKYLKYSDIKGKAKMRMDANYWASKEVIHGYSSFKTIVKVTAIFETKGERIIHEYSFNKNGNLVNSKILERKFI